MLIGALVLVWRSRKNKSQGIKSRSKARVEPIQFEGLESVFLSEPPLLQHTDDGHGVFGNEGHDDAIREER